MTKADIKLKEFVEGRNWIDLKRIGERDALKEKHRDELKSFDKETKRQLAEVRKAYTEALRGKKDTETNQDAG